MQYIQCRNCGFWNEDSVNHCPNCGIGRPQINRDLLAAGFPSGMIGLAGLLGTAAKALIDADTGGATAIPWPIIDGVLGGTVGVLLVHALHVFFRCRPRMEDTIRRYYHLLLGILGGLLGFEVTFWALGYFDSKSLGAFLISLIGSMTAGEAGWSFLHKQSEPSLQHKKVLIVQRSQVLVQQQQKLWGIWQQVCREPSIDRWKRHQQLLCQADSRLQRLRVQYAVKLRQIQLIRWQNPLDPLRAGWNRLTVSEIEAGLPNLANIRAQGEQLLEQWKAEAQTEGPERPEGLAGEHCIPDLQAVLDECEELRQAILARKVVLTVQEATRGAGSGSEMVVPEFRRPRDKSSSVELEPFEIAFQELEEAFAHSDAQEEVDRLLSGESASDKPEEHWEERVERPPDSSANGESDEE